MLASLYSSLLDILHSDLAISSFLDERSTILLELKSFISIFIFRTSEWSKSNDIIDDEMLSPLLILFKLFCSCLNLSWFLILFLLKSLLLFDDFLLSISSSSSSSYILFLLSSSLLFLFLLDSLLLGEKALPERIESIMLSRIWSLTAEDPFLDFE